MRSGILSEWLACEKATDRDRGATNPRQRRGWCPEHVLGEAREREGDLHCETDLKTRLPGGALMAPPYHTVLDCLNVQWSM